MVLVNLNGHCTLPVKEFWIGKLYSVSLMLHTTNLKMKVLFQKLFSSPPFLSLIIFTPFKVYIYFSEQEEKSYVKPINEIVQNLSKINSWV